jgi:hypothetical protein
MVSKKFKRFSRGYLSSSVSLGVGAQVLEQPAFGAIGQQGARGLQLGSQFLPPIALIGIGGETIRQTRRLQNKNKRR